MCARLHPCIELRNELVQVLRVGTCRHDTVLGTLQLGRRHHLHGIGDLLCILDTRNTTPNITQTRHNYAAPAFAVKLALNSAMARRKASWFSAVISLASMILSLICG